MRLLFAWLFAGITLSARADEKFPVLQVGSQVYSNVTVTSVSATDVFFTHASGLGNAKLKLLSPELQKHFSFDPETASAVERLQATNKLKYHEQLLKQPAIHAPDMTRTAAAKIPGPAVWRADFPGAMKQAQSENKLVLLEFTGSDWCPTCIQFNRNVLTTEKFAAYANARFELVKLDFPRHTPQNPELARANHALADQFHINGFPTVVVLDASGKELWRQLDDSTPNAPEAFVAELERISRK